MHTSFYSVAGFQRDCLRLFSSFEPLVRGGCALSRDAAVRPLSINPCISVKFFKDDLCYWIMCEFINGWKSYALCSQYEVFWL